MRMKPIWLVVLLAVICGAAVGAYEYLVVSARDTKGPVIAFGGEELVLSVHDDRSRLLEGVTAKDDRDGDVTASLLVETVSAIRSDHSVSVTYVAFDKNGNASKAVRNVRYSDYEPPRFRLKSPLMFRSGITADPFAYIEALDPLDGDLSNRVKVIMRSGESSISDVGIYEVELRVTNKMGDTAKLTVPLEVYTNGTYNATVQLSEYLIYVKKGETFDKEAYLKSVTLGGRIYEAGETPEGTRVRIDSDVRSGVPGVYTVDYTVTYADYKGCSRLIVVVEE